MNSFAKFLREMGPRPSPKHTLERIDNSKGYAIENCRWATMQEQQNNRRGLKLLTHNGKTQTMEDWSREIGIGQTTLSYRLGAGWPIERILSPKDHRRRDAR